MQELGHIINDLDETYRKPFLLFFEGWKYDEIAARMNLPIGTVKSRIFFARKVLKQNISFAYRYDTSVVN